MYEDRGSSGGQRTIDGVVSLADIPLHSTNLLTVLDADGVVRYESPAIERLFGFDPAEPVGTPVADFFHPADRDRVLEAFGRVVEADDDTVGTVEYRHLQADGSYRWVESVAAANPTPTGHYVVNTRDVSEQRERERELERANERLEEFARVVAHDLRNPLNVAQSYLQLAAESTESEHHETVADALDRMADLVDGLLANARIQSGDLDLEVLDLGRLGEDCWRNVETGGASLTVGTGADGGIRADRFRLMQLLENLFRNAVQHGGDDVAVELGGLDGGFFVADDGPGIPAGERDRVLELGYSSDPHGTGFGLPIVQQVVETHDWTLRVTEGPEGGARFEITGVETV